MEKNHKMIEEMNDSLHDYLYEENPHLFLLLEWLKTLNEFHSSLEDHDYPAINEKVLEIKVLIKNEIGKRFSEILLRNIK